MVGVRLWSKPAFVCEISQRAAAINKADGLMAVNHSPADTAGSREVLRLADAVWTARGWARATREVVGGYMVEAERNLDWGLGHME